MNAAAVIHVVAAVVTDDRGRVLIARRAAHRHQGGLWEFPGGKVEQGESSVAALTRELDEEVGIKVERARPLIRIRHDYSDKSVLLDVWRVSSFRGEAQGREGQPIDWIAPDDLPLRSFPAANRSLITAARLPSIYLITPEPDDSPEFWCRFETLLQSGVTLVQWRAKGLDECQYTRLTRKAIDLCHNAGARVLLNASPALVVALGADGVHLTSARLRDLSARPLSREFWVAASCHTLAELHHAQNIGVDFAVVGAVLPTGSHPEATPLEWSGLRNLCDAAVIPVYALGGMRPGYLQRAFEQGAQGIAAISSLWTPEASDVRAARDQLLTDG